MQRARAGAVRHHGPVSASWSTPDPGRVVTGTAFGRPYEHVEPATPPVRSDVLAALLTLAVPLLDAGPVGLAWAALAPRAVAVLAAGRYSAADPSTDAHIAGDGYFLAAVLLAGAITGLTAWAFGRRHGPAVVSALAVGGLGAAFVVMRVGEAVGVGALQRAVQGGATQVDVALDLGAVVALTGWPVAALLAFLVATLVRGEEAALSSG